MDPNQNGSTHLLICVVSNTALVNEIVSGFLDIGVTGATVIDSHGMLQLAGARIPVFSGFRQLLEGDRQPNRTLFSVIDDDKTLNEAMRLVEDACGDLEEPSTGIMFVVPVTRVKGLAAPVD